MPATSPVTANDPRAREVLSFWFGEGPGRGMPRKAWFRKDAEFDAEIQKRFSALYAQAAANGLAAWCERAGECLALVIVLDQFPRNMFRGTARAFASDFLALDTAKRAVERAFDAASLPVERLFFYLPFEHSESLDDQWRALALIGPLAAWPETADVYGYAVRHWDVIRRFGRFPHRNAALGRANTAQETEFLKTPGSGF